MAQSETIKKLPVNFTGKFYGEQLARRNVHPVPMSRARGPGTGPGANRGPDRGPGTTNERPTKKAKKRPNFFGNGTPPSIWGRLSFSAGQRNLGGIPNPSKFTTYFWHCPDIPDTKTDTKTSVFVNAVNLHHHIYPKNRHNTAHFVSILNTLCRFCVDFVSIFVNNSSTTFIDNQ